MIIVVLIKYIIDFFFLRKYSKIYSFRIERKYSKPIYGFRNEKLKHLSIYVHINLRTVQLNKFPKTSFKFKRLSHHDCSVQMIFKTFFLRFWVLSSPQKYNYILWNCSIMGTPFRELKKKLF